jgi:peptidylprolyl isomerase
MDFTMDGKPLGRVVFELRNDIAPIACENFRSLCTGWKGKGRFDKPLHYKSNRVHRCIPDRLLMAGDIICQDGTSGESIYGDTFEDENFVLRHAGPGTLSTCNRGPDTNDSRFFISLGKCCLQIISTFHLIHLLTSRFICYTLAIHSFTRNG